MKNEFLHEIVVTAIVIKDGKYLITKRSASEKRFPNMWTVPGGRLSTEDYANMPKETKDYWYNVLEKVLKKEVEEESGIKIENIEYVTSLGTVHPDKAPSLVISCMADYVSGEIQLQEHETSDAAWVTLEESKNYDLLDGIYDELLMADNKRKGIKTEWKRFQ